LKFVDEDFSTRAPSEEELLQYFKHLREDKKWHLLAYGKHIP